MLAVLATMVVPSTGWTVPSVGWTPAAITSTVSAGGSATVKVSFTASEGLDDVRLRVVPALATLVSVSPDVLGTIDADQTVELEVTVSAPAGALPTDSFEGTIQLRGRSKRKTFARPLPIRINVSGAILGPGGGTVHGGDGSMVTLAPGTVLYPVEVNVGQLPLGSIVAPTNGLPLVVAFSLLFQPANTAGDFPAPSVPLGVALSAPADLPVDTEFIVAQEILVDDIEGPTPGLRPRLVPVGLASVEGGMIVTETGPFDGVRAGGMFAIVEGTGSGYSTGVVTEQLCFLFFCFDLPQPGVTVSNSTNTLVALTDGAGRYTLFLSGGPFSVTGFNPFTGASGSAGGNIAVDGSTVAADISLAPLVAPPITRDGIRNGGFERCNLTSWAVAGSGAARQQLGPTSTGVIIRPTEGQCMGDINTGAGAIGEVGSSLLQNFIVPAGVETLRLDFNFVSEEFPEFVGSIFDDAFHARITTPNGTSTFAEVRVNNSGGFTLIGDCSFPGGDNTCGQTGWREASVDLSAFAGTGTPITVELLFSAIDAGDDIYDTHVLVDNIRFGTLWVDAKVVGGATANQARIQGEVLQATELLSQAGLNVQLRGVQTIADPGALLDTDITWTTGANCSDGRVNGRLTAEEAQIVGLSRSATPTDLNVYYVRSLTGGGALAIALGPDDFCVDVNALTNSGVLMTDTVFPETLAHEAGHIAISPATAGNTLEHSAADAANLMRAPRTVPRTTVSRAQSAAIGTPLIVP